MHFLLFSNVNKDPEQKVTNRLEQLILSRGHSVTRVQEGNEAPEEGIPGEQLASVDVVIVLGGDGTMLRASHAVGAGAVPMIGLNLGTTGFLTEVECSAMEDMVDRLICGDYVVEDRMQLTGMIYRKGDCAAKTDGTVGASVDAQCGENNADSQNAEPTRDMQYTGKSGDAQRDANITTGKCPDRQPDVCFSALNDVVIIREGVLRLIALKIYVNDVFFDTYEADGVIISTPTGSTGYNLSAGGPIVSPKTRATVLTPISPHSLSKKSIVFDAGDRVRIELEEKRKTQVNEAIVSFDGYKNYEISVGDQVEVQASAVPLHLIRLEERSFFEVISRKFDRPAG